MAQSLPTPRTLHFAEAQIHSHRYQPAVLLEHDNVTYPLMANWSDTVHVFEHRQRLYVLTINVKLATIRLDIFVDHQLEALESFVLVDREQIETIAGAKWQKLTPKSLAVLLASQLLRKGGVA